MSGPVIHGIKRRRTFSEGSTPSPIQKRLSFEDDRSGSSSGTEKKSPEVITLDKTTSEERELSPTVSIERSPKLDKVALKTAAKKHKGVPWTTISTVPEPSAPSASTFFPKPKGTRATVYKSFVGPFAQSSAKVHPPLKALAALALGEDIPSQYRDALSNEMGTDMSYIYNNLWFNIANFVNHYNHSELMKKVKEGKGESPK